MDELFGFKLPDEATMSELLGVLRLADDEGVRAYEISDSYRIKLKLAFHLFEKYFQVVLFSEGRPIQSTTFDGLWSLHVLNGGAKQGLRAENSDMTITVDIYWDPAIQVSVRNANH